MARFPRVIVPGLPHHVTQRGNRKVNVYRDEQDRRVYLRLLRERSKHDSMDILSYCLMTNHVHLVVVPERHDSVSKGLQAIHGLYATYFNRKYSLSGHLWQGRFYSCVLDALHLWCAVRYVERNPVRAGLVARAELYPWSSAQAHTGLRPDPLLSEGWPPDQLTADWSSWLSREDDPSETRSIRDKTKTGRPCGSDAFVEHLELTLQRSLKPRKGGRPSDKK